MSSNVVRRQWDVPVRMRDGVRLSADLYFPVGGPAAGPYPGIVARTPYDNQTSSYVEIARVLADHGYVVLLQDVRGRYDSEGSWETFANEGDDGYDTIEWLATQPWCTGRIGTFGGSYGGWCQWAAAREHPPHLVTMVSTAAVGAWMQEVPLCYGCVTLISFAIQTTVGGRTGQNPVLVPDWPTVFRHLPLSTMDARAGGDVPLWREWLSHPTLDDYWRDRRLDDDFANIDLPVLHITGWYDGDQPGALFFYKGMTDFSPCAKDQSLVVGPWDHGATRHPKQELGGVNFGEEAVIDTVDLHLRWFDRWMKVEERRDASQERPAARVFLTGVNSWRDAPSWPPPGMRGVPLYLRSGGKANTLHGDGRMAWEPPGEHEPADCDTNDPIDPVPSFVVEDIFADDATDTPLDHRFKHDRQDVLVYTGSAQEDALNLAGFPRVRLLASTDGPDTDWHVALHALSTDGTSMMLAEGRLRGRFRESLERETLLEPGHVYEFSIALGAVGHMVKPGHRLRLTVTSSDFPMYDRNPNTGHAIGQDDEVRVAVNQIYHQPDRLSSIELPVAPAGFAEQRNPD